MKSQALTSWIQILTGFAVLAGLGLVVWELQQTRDLVRAQLANAGYLSGSDTQRTFMGETFASTYAKACFQPEDLTDAELMQMTRYHEHLLLEVRRSKAYAEIGTHEFDWRQLARRNISLWLSTKVGRAEYVNAKKKGGYASWIYETAKGLLAGGELETCEKFHSDIFELVRAEGDLQLR